MAAIPPRSVTARLVNSSSRVTQSQSTFPAGDCTSRARWPMANEGAVPIPTSRSSCRRNSLWWPRCRSAKVVQRWPSGPMYWRSSSQIKQCAGGASPVSSYCIPHVTQMKLLIPPIKVAYGLEARRPPVLRLVDADDPVDAEFVQEIPDLGAPGRRRRRLLGGAAFGQAVVDLGEPVLVGTAHGDGHVFAGLGRVFRVAVSADDDGAVGVQPGIRDAVPRAGRRGDALLVHGPQVEFAAQNLLIVLHGLASA